MWAGLFWAVARPLIMLAVIASFRGLSGASLGVGVSYALYLYSGLVAWFFFSEATTAVASSLQRDAGIIQKVYFPRLISPLACIGAEAYNLILAGLPMAILMVAYGAHPDWNVLWLPLVLFHWMLLALGLGLVFSSLALMSRDWERVLRFGLYLGFWLSPVFYSEQMIPEPQRIWYLANPLSGVLMATRGALFSELSFPMLQWLYSCAFSWLLLAVGVVLFQRSERNLADRL
jgi:lipopolysaccharide transport system permease protein